MRGILAAVATALMMMVPVSGAHAQGEYNMWTCFASPTQVQASVQLRFQGYSQIFEAGSGAGQQGRVNAFNNAINACRSSVGVNCNARIEECQVTRFTLWGGGGGQQQGRWYQANGHSCQSLCNSYGRLVGTSPEGAQCASGENRPTSATQAGIQYYYGTWGGAAGMNVPAQSWGGYCYQPGQTRDNDRTDITVGCFCR